MWLFGGLLVKHFLIAHLWDTGYSQCRDPNERHWWYHLELWVLLELVGTLTCSIGLYTFQGSVLTAIPALLSFMGLEMLVLIAGALTERKASFESALSVHLWTECATALFYFTMGWVLVQMQP